MSAPELIPQSAPQPPATGVPLPAASPESTAPATVPALTPEEQMERFAQDLKENDWGHQPC